MKPKLNKWGINDQEINALTNSNLITEEFMKHCVEKINELGIKNFSGSVKSEMEWLLPLIVREVLTGKKKVLAGKPEERMG